jgi:hypothetical protein
VPLPHHPVVAPLLLDTDRRTEPRTLCHAPAQLVPYPAGKHTHPIDVIITDHSQSGIGLTYSEGLLIGQSFVVREPTITQGKTCLYRVVQCDSMEDGNFRIALSAMEMPQDEWAPFEPKKMPGVDLGTKLLYLIFAIAGAATIVLTAILLRHGHH